MKIVHSESVIVRSESVELIFIVYEECAANLFTNRGRRAPAAAMLKQEELAFINAVSTLQVTPALLREQRTALSTRKRRTVVPAGFRGRAPGGGPRTSQRPPSRQAGKRKAKELQTRGTQWSLPLGTQHLMLGPRPYPQNHPRENRRSTASGSSAHPWEGRHTRPFWPGPQHRFTQVGRSSPQPWIRTRPNPLSQLRQQPGACPTTCPGL